MSDLKQIPNESQMSPKSDPFGEQTLEPDRTCPTRDDIVTAVDVVAAQEELEQQALDALPGDPSFCTYSKGYLNQPVYTCLTCYGENKKVAANDDKLEYMGVCYGCYISCHTTHDVVELYHKRHFRCDCGTARNPGISCTIDPSKKQHLFNEENNYTYNFDGRFCTCRKVYVAEKEESVMVECYVCQDWFHEECIGVKIPTDESFDDFVCERCILLHPFVGLFSTFPGVSNTQNYESSVCISKDTSLTTDSASPVFTRKGWKHQVCNCQACTSVLESHNLKTLLLSEEDCYEPPADPDAGRSTMDLAMSKLNHADRIETIQGIRAYESLKQDLMAYLKQFSSSDKVVTEEDIRSFFNEKEAQATRKRRGVR